MKVRRVSTVIMLVVFVMVGKLFAGDMPEDISVTTDSQGFVAVPSEYGPAETTRRLTETLENNPNITLLGVVNHTEAAASVDLDLWPTRVILFGNPALGTPLMQLENRVAVDLPQKMLVWEDEDGTVRITYNDPEYVLRRHGLEDMPASVGNIAGALSSIAAAAGER